MNFCFLLNNSSASRVAGEYIVSKTSPTSWALAIATKFLSQESHWLSSFKNVKSAGSLFIPFFKIFAYLLVIEVVAIVLVDTRLLKAKVNVKLGSYSTI